MGVQGMSVRLRGDDSSKAGIFQRRTGRIQRRCGTLPYLPSSHPAMKIVEVRHPLVQHKIGLLRDPTMSTKDFREVVNELGTLLAYEATADLETEAHTMAGWAGPVQVQRIAGAKITVVPILRAGLGML